MTTQDRRRSRGNDPALPLPTLNYLRRMGITQVEVICTLADCRRRAHLTLDALGLLGGTPFPEINKRRRFTCFGCGGHVVDVSIDWRDYNPKAITR